MKLVKKKTSVAEVETAPKYANLREVMDYTRDISIFYSGVEYDVYLKGCYDMGIRNFLMSFHYLQGRSISQIKDMFDEPIHLFIDSGAHTYQNDPKYQDTTVEDWEKHLKKYLKWAEKNKDSIFAIANFDFENLVGEEQVGEWNRKYFEPFMLKTGIPVCFVWHQNSYMTWDKYCERYPYVGFSSVNTEGESISMDEYREKLRIAEKYNSICHGFGMTRTSMLPQLPFYTVDSTSWKVGMRYGLTSVWTGKKVQQFKKEDWETKIVPVISNYTDIDLDLDKLQEFYEPEVIRANVYAYLKAEEFIRERLKPLTYWKRVKAVKVDLENLPADFFPSAEWVGGSKSTESILEYARKMNINPELEEAYIIICDLTVLLNWDSLEFEDFKTAYYEEDSKLLKGLHDDFINRIVPDDDARVKDLQEFYRSCVSGSNDKLLQLGTNFDRTVKERDSYLEDEEEFEYLDVPQEEVRKKLSALLPAPSDEESEGAPEIDELDKEIYAKADIVPVFDERGKFVKGQKAVRKPKQVYSKKYPKLACDTCYAAAKCPEFKAGFVCAYQQMFKRFDTRNMSDIIQSMQGIVEHNMERMQKAMIMETISGSIDPVVSQLMDTNLRYMNMLKQMYENGSAEVLKQTKIVRADGTQETTTQISNPSSGGILEKMFSGMSGGESKKELEPRDDDIEVPAE